MVADVTRDAVPVTLVPHDPAWADMAAAEAVRIAGALGPALLRVEHIGSTAIPGICAKPTVDLMPVVRDIAAVDERRGALEALGYFWRGEFGIEGRRYMLLERNQKRIFHVHCFADAHPDMVNHLVFRDYLRSHRDEALAYEAMKREAAAAHPNDSRSYAAYKSDWVRACLERAQAWAAAR